MHNRQTGAAHVPMMFFLLILVLFLGATGFAFMTNARNGELIVERNTARAEAETARKRDLLIEHYVTDVGNVIQKPGAYTGRDGQEGIYGGAAITYPGIVKPADVRAAMDASLSAAGLSAASGLENVLGSMVTKIGQLNQRIKDIEAERDKALAEKGEVDRKFQAATTDASAKAREFGQNLDQARSDYESSKQDKDNRIAQGNESLRAKQDELATEKERAATKEKELNQEIAKHQMQNSALIARETLRKTADVSDGVIVAARAGVPTAFISLGRKDLLQPGTVFRVKSPSSSKVKGYAQVTRVEDVRAEVALMDFADPIGDFARDGDQIFNDFYSPRVTRTIYLMGRFSAPYNKPELTNLLKRLGNNVVDKMAPGVDTVILGGDPVNEAGDGFNSVMESAEFKLASELRVEFAYLSSIRDLIKL
jgi:hypothetical protein